MGIISIDQFRASGVDCEDIGTRIPGQDLEGCTGRVYLDTLYIEHWTDARHGVAPADGPTWLLILGNMQYQGSLADMELELYRWALSDGHLVTDGRPSGFRLEFPEFSPFDIPLPILDTGWSDYSWHHDAMPFFVHEPSGTGVWVNHADPSEREMPDRFIAVSLDWDLATSTWMHDMRGDRAPMFTIEDESVLLSSLPNFVRPRAIAHAFASSIYDECAEMSDAEQAVLADRHTLKHLLEAAASGKKVHGEPVDRWTEIRERNARPDYAGSCATHDFLDANVIMAAAFEKVMGRPYLGDDQPSEEDTSLWNMAWDIAKAERLTAEVVPAPSVH